MVSAASTSYGSSIPSVAGSQPFPQVDFGSKIQEFSAFIGRHMSLIGQIVGVTRIVADIQYIFSSDFMQEKTPFGIVGNLLLCFGDFGSILPFLSYWGVIDLGKIAAKIGQVSFLKPLMQVPITSVLSVINIVGYTYFGIDAIVRLCQPETKGPHRRQAWFDIANAVCQIALSGLILAGMTRVSVLLPVGGLCLAMGSVCFLHRCFLPPETVTQKKKTRPDAKKQKLEWVPLPSSAARRQRQQVQEIIYCR